jgi:hypothetical protein
VWQIEDRHVDVVADLVEESAQKGARLDHLSVGGSEHPHADLALPVLEPRIETVELALPPAGAGAQHVDAGRGGRCAPAPRAERRAYDVDETLSRSPHAGARALFEGLDHSVGGRAERRGGREWQGAPRVGAVVLSLLLGAQPSIEGETAGPLGLHERPAVKSRS